MPDGVEDQMKEPTLQEIINIKLIESVEKERLMELLKERLMECGWKDEMKASIPDSIKAELLQKSILFSCLLLFDHQHALIMAKKGKVIELSVERLQWNPH